MGASYSLEANQDSPTEPGKMVVLSSELPEVTPDGLVETALDILKNVPPHVEPAVKTKEIEEHSENSYTVKAILDGPKLDAAGFGRKDGTDRVFQWLKVTYDPSKMLIHTESLIPDGGAWVDEAPDGVKVFLETNTRFLKDPTRLEYWWVKDGVHMAGEDQANYVKGFIDMLLQICKPRKVNFSPDCDSIAEPGQKSALSAPMDDQIDFDKLWQTLLDHKTTYGHIQGAEIVEVSDNEVLVTGENGVEPAGGAISVEWNKDAGKITRTKKVAGKVVEVNHTAIHQSPLLMEVWLVDLQGQRVADKKVAKMYSVLIDMLLEKVAKDSSWF